MIQAAENTAADWRADNERTRPVIIRAVTDFGRFADDLIRCREHEIGILHFRDRLHAIHRRTDCNACNGRFRKRRIKRAMLAELLQQTFRCREHAAFEPTSSPSTKTSSSRSISSFIAWRIASIYSITAIIAYPLAQHHPHIHEAM